MMAFVIEGFLSVPKFSHMRKKGEPSTDMADRLSFSDISFDDITNGVSLFVATKQGWVYQIRRSWKVREVPVSESTIFDYEWKIYPSREHLEAGGRKKKWWLDLVRPDNWEESRISNFRVDRREITRIPTNYQHREWGLYYILRLSEEGFILEHSNHNYDGGGLNEGNYYTHTLFPLRDPLTVYQFEVASAVYHAGEFDPGLVYSPFDEPHKWEEKIAEMSDEDKAELMERVMSESLERMSDPAYLVDSLTHLCSRFQCNHFGSS
jgi:hypothetical protein